jgi:predicted secreted acid phosphatase
MLRRLLAVATMSLVLVLSVLVPPTQAAGMPSKRAWLHDTAQALSGSRAYVAYRVRDTRGKLALNLDIDNTSLQTYYDRGKAVPATLRTVRYAKSRGVDILFNTGRNVSLRTKTVRQLRRAGFPVDNLCMKHRGESLSHSKQRCRRIFVKGGYKLIENIGNRSTDFVGGNYMRAYKLPNYGNRLG